MKKHIGGVDELTENLVPRHTIQTMAGRMSHEAWLEREMKRINKLPCREVFVRRNNDGTVCLCENRYPDGSPRWVPAEKYNGCHKWEGRTK